MSRASLAVQTQRVNLVVQGLEQQRPSEAILSTLMTRFGLSRRQAYRYLLRAQGQRELQPVPGPKAVFTVNLPQRLIQAVRVRCRREGRRISHVVTEVLEQWLEQSSTHG